MPAVLENLVSKLRAKGHNKRSSYAIATAALQKEGYLQPGTQKSTGKVPRKKRKRNV